MLNVIRVILFVIVNLAGWFTIPASYHMADKTGFVPELPPGLPMETFKYWFFGMGMWVWIACAVVSIAYFFMENEWKNWVLLSPMFITALFCAGILIYFNFFYTLA